MSVHNIAHYELSFVPPYYGRTNPQEGLASSMWPMELIRAGNIWQPADVRIFNYNTCKKIILEKTLCN
jgi:hypothetical protein